MSCETPSNSKQPRLDHGILLQQLPTFQSSLLGVVQREMLKASGSHAEIFSALASPIDTDHLARPLFPSEC